MFTGLIECTGTIAALRRGSDGALLELLAPIPANEVSKGDSIAVNGACLTVTSMGGGRFCFDMSLETLDRTTFHKLSPGRRVNLERALRMGDRLDGHMVTGHVDCVGRLEAMKRQGNSMVLSFSLPGRDAGMLVEKGSVAVDGISLTVNAVESDGFTVAVIPHTLAKTTLSDVAPGVEVNIETDIIGKYLARFLAPHRGKEGLTMEKLMQNGFI